MFNVQFSLSIVSYPSSIVYCPKSKVQCLSSIVLRLMTIVHCPLPMSTSNVHFPLPFVWWPLSIVLCLMTIVHCPLSDNHCPLSTVHVLWACSIKLQEIDRLVALWPGSPLQLTHLAQANINLSKPHTSDSTHCSEETWILNRKQVTVNIHLEKLCILIVSKWQ